MQNNPAQSSNAKKLFSNGKLVKRCAIEMAHSFNDEKMVNNFKSVSLSYQTVGRCLCDMMNDYVCGKLAELTERCKYFSLALDDSTDITDVSQLLLFVKTTDSTFAVDEELLDIVPLNFQIKASDIYAALVSVVNKYGGFSKCSSVVTDGACVMTGTKSSLVALLKGDGVDCYTFHCIIHHHQEELCGRFILINDAMKTVIKVINLIRGGNKTHRHRKFVAFLKELDTEIRDLSLHTEARWLRAR